MWNQYPPSFYEPIIESALNAICGATTEEVANDRVSDNSLDIPKSLLFIQYRGEASKDFARALHQIKALCNTVFTMRKLQTVLPSLKPEVIKSKFSLQVKMSTLFSALCRPDRLSCLHTSQGTSTAPRSAVLQTLQEIP